MNKYNARKTPCRYGHVHDSSKEAGRCNTLHLMQQGGVIKALEIQPKFVLVPKYKWQGKAVREVAYYADFRYFDKHTNKDTIEDVKGRLTDVYRLKKKLLLSRLDDRLITFLET